MTGTVFSTRLVSTESLQVEISIKTHIVNVKNFFEFQKHNTEILKTTITNNDEEAEFKVTLPQKEAKRVIEWLIEMGGQYKKD